MKMMNEIEGGMKDMQGKSEYIKARPKGRLDTSGLHGLSSKLATQQYRRAAEDCMARLCVYEGVSQPTNRDENTRSYTQKK